jgi:xanthine dehydrogenase molybdopterin-binding subunit B
MLCGWKQGAGVTEVEIDCLTGDCVVVRADILMDVGQSINPALDIGKVFGKLLSGWGDCLRVHISCFSTVQCVPFNIAIKLL